MVFTGKRARFRCAGAAVVLAPLAMVSGCGASGTLARELQEGQAASLHRRCDRLRDDAGFESRVLGSKSIAVRAERERAPAGTPVVVYGASWCKPCDTAISYLKARGIPHVKRDVEEDADAARDAKALVADAGLHGSRFGLPIIDVRGTVMSGFYPCVVDWAWERP